MMKKILLILSFLFCFFYSKSQYTITQNIGSGSTLVQVPPNGGFKASLVNRSFNDTFAANLTPISLYPGSMVFTSSDSKLWVRNANVDRWVAVGTGSISAAGNTTNIQINRYGSFATPGNDTLSYRTDSGLYVKNLLNGTALNVPHSTTTLGAMYIGGTKWIHDYTPAGNSWNISIGNGAGSFNTNQNNKLNISIGEGAGTKWKSNGNIAIGYHAGFLHEAADTAQDFGNVFIGYESGGFATGGRNSVGVGINTLKNMTTGGYSNAAVGKGTLLACTTCGANSVIGPSVASGAVFTGEWNSITGADVMVNATTATGNAVVGGMAMMDGTTASENSLVGYFAGLHMTTGSSNVMVGPRTGLATTTGNYNIFLGHGAGTPIGNTTGRLSINYNPSLSLGTATLIGDLTNKRIAINKTEDAALTYTLEVGGTIAAATVPFTASTKDTLVYWNPSTTQFERRLVASGASGLTVGTSTIASGTNTRVLFDNSGVLGEYAISGSGNVAMTTSPAFTTPNIGTPSAGTLTNTTGYLWNNIANPTGTQTLTFNDGVLNAWTVSSDAETFHTYTANSLTSGKVISVTSNSTTKAAGNALYNGTSSGANASSSITNTAFNATVSNTGTTSTNVGFNSDVSGASTNWAFKADAGNYRSTGAAGYYALNSAGTAGASMTYDNATTATIGTTGGVRLDLNAPSSNILSRGSFVIGAGIDFGNAVSLDVYKSASGTSNIQNWRSSGGTVLANVNQSGRFFIGSSTSATSLLHLDAGTTSVPPMRFTSGPLATGGNILAGNVEFLTDKWYGTTTTGPAQYEFTMNNAALTTNRVPYVSNGRLTDAGTFLFDGSKFTFQGAIQTSTAQITTTTTLTSTMYVVRVDATSGAITTDLPDATTCQGRTYTVKKIDASANNVTIDPNGSQTLDGATTKVITTQYAGYVIQSNGTNWDVIGAF